MRLLRRERALLRGEGGDRGEERTIEEADVDVAHFALDRLPLAPHLLTGVREAAGSGEDPKILRPGGHEVRPAEVSQLNAMLEEPQHPVVAREGRSLGPADVPLGDERVERIERSALADPVIREPVHELEQLHREFDVADAAGSELELVRHVRRRNVLRDALAHPLDAVDEVLACRAGPDLRLDRAHIGLAERGIPGDRARLQQGLELPALRPAVVVRQVRVERAHQGALLALRTKVRVDLPQRRLDLDARDSPHGLHGEPGGDVDDAGFSERLRRSPRRRRRRRSRRRR